MEYCENNIPSRLLHRVYLEYPFAKGKAYKLEMVKDDIIGIITILIKSRKTNNIMGTTSFTQSDALNV